MSSMGPGPMTEPSIEPLSIWTEAKGVQVVWFADGEYWQGTVDRLEPDVWVMKDVHIVEDN